MGQQLQLKMKRPPIHEVVCGFVFEKSIEMDPFLMGIFWNEVLKERYPKRKLLPLINPFESAPEGSIMRAWFLTEKEDLLVQLQHNRLYLNWRRVEKDDIYPCFSGQQGLMKRTKDELAAMSDYFEKPKIRQVELTKINHIKIDNCTSLLEVADYLNLGLTTENEITHFKKETNTKVSEGDLFISIQSAKAKQDQQPLFIVETRIISTPSEHEKLDSVLESLNTKLNRSFVEILSDHAKTDYDMEWL